MYLFSRRRQADPTHGRAAVAMAVETAGKVTQITGLEVRPWMAVMSPELGSIVWSCFIEHLGDLEMATDKLAADDAYADYVENASSLFTGPAEDTLMQIVHGAPGGEQPAYVQAVRAEAANGAITAALAAGVEIAETASRITGHDTGFAVNVTGSYAGVGWFTGAPDLATLEAANTALMANADWLSLVDRVGASFQPGTSTTLYRRLA